MAPGNSGLAVRLLGPIEAWRDGEQLHLGGGRQRALLAALALRAGQVVSSDRLIDELWGEHPPETAATALHGLVSQLRKAVELDRGQPTVLVTRSPGYALLIEPGAIDAAQFERLLGEAETALEDGEAAPARSLFAEALALWRGPALDGVSDQSFARTEAHRLDELRLHAQEGRIEAELALGHGGAVVAELEALIAREPLRERPRGQLMRALYTSGRQADALEAYRDARRMLHDELGIEPGPELRDLERQILEHDPVLGAPVPVSRGRHDEPRRGVMLALAIAALMVVVGIASGASLLLRDDAPASVVVEPDEVAVVEPDSGRLAGRIPVGARPTAVTVGHGSVWVANTDDGTVSRIDPKQRAVVETYGIGAPASSLAVTADAVWVGNGSAGTVSRIDPRPGGGVDLFDVSNTGDGLVRDTVYGVAAAAGSVWVGVGTVILRLDAPTGNRQVKIELGAAPIAVAAGEGAVWAVTGDERLLRIEPSTNRIAAAAELTNFPVDVATGLGRVWVVTVAAELATFDPLLRPTGLIQLGEVFADAVAVGTDAVWIGEARAEEPNRIVQLDAERPGRETAYAELGPHPTDVAVGEGLVWVTVREPDP